MDFITLRPFLSALFSADPTGVPRPYGADSGNMLHAENGDLRERRGWNNLVAGPAGFISSGLFTLIEGINTSGTRAQEILSVETRTGPVTKPYSILPVPPYTRTEILDGVSALALNSGKWGSLVFGNYSYHWNNSDSNYPFARHEIGNAASWSDIGEPDAPALPTIKYVRNILTGSELAYGKLDFSGISKTVDVAYSGPCASTDTVLAAEHIIIGCTTTGVCTVTITLDGATGPGQPNWTNADVFYTVFGPYLGVASPFRWDATTFKVEFINADGTPKEFEMEQNTMPFSGSSDPTLSWRGFLRWPEGAARTDRDNIKKIRLTFRVTAVSSDDTKNLFYFGSPQVGGFDYRDWPAPFQNQTQAKFQATYYDATAILESALSPQLSAPWQQLLGWGTQINGVSDYLGTVPQITVAASGDAAIGDWRLYAKWAAIDDDGRGTEIDSLLRLVGTFDEDSAGNRTQNFMVTWEEFQLLAEYDPAGGVANVEQTKIRCGTVFKSWVVWGIKGGGANIQHSQVGQPTIWFRDGQDPVNDDRAGEYVLQGDNSDDPVNMFQTGDALVILGSKGAYAQQGDRPHSMTPVRQIPNAPGCANRLASALIRTKEGVPGVVYLSEDRRSLWFLTVLQVAGASVDYRLFELTARVRGKVWSHIFGSATPSATEEVEIEYCPLDDSLHLRYSNKSGIMRRESQIDRARGFEWYDFTNAGKHWLAWTYSSQYGLRGLNSDGSMDDFEYDSENAMAEITGALADNGAARPTDGTFWLSPRFTNGLRTRIDWVNLDKQTEADAVVVQVVSDDQTDSRTFTNRRNKRFDSGQTGWFHQFRITLPDGSGAVRGLQAKRRRAGEARTQ